MSNSERLYFAARAKRDEDPTPRDNVLDEVACAEVVSAIYFGEFGEAISEENGNSTYWLFQAFGNTKKWVEVEEPERGDIIISPTGYSSKGAEHGHTGYVMESGKIASNDSATGLFLENYTVDSWKRKFGEVMGFPVKFYRIK